MPTFTLSWTDLALAGLTVLLIATVAWVGSSALPDSQTSQTSSASNQKKGKKNKGKKLNAVLNQRQPSAVQEGPHNLSKAKGREANSVQWYEPGKNFSKETNSQGNNRVIEPIETLTPRSPTEMRRNIDDLSDPDPESATYSSVLSKTQKSPPIVLSSTESQSEEGWEKVFKPKSSSSISSRRSSGYPASTASPSSSILTKKQRQNAKRREEQKADKKSEEADRLTRLATHREQQNVARMKELYGKASQSKSSR